MKILALDTEATTYEKGNPFSKRNKLMCVAAVGPVYGDYFDIEHSSLPYNGVIELLTRLLEETELLIGFNIKYDLHWLRRYIPGWIPKFRIWDCQLAQFLLSKQTQPYPSLNDCLKLYDLPLKLDTIEKEYWSKGIDTSEVPADLLETYCLKDAILTGQLYLKQKELLKDKLLTLFNLQCDDLLVLEEMEFRGLMYDTKTSKEKSKETEEQLNQTEKELNELVAIPDCPINWNSPAHVSAVLYGGTINVPSREEVQRPRKDGSVRVYTRACTLPVVLPRLVEPIEGSETSLGFSTSEASLRSVKAGGKAKRILELILQQSDLDKLKGTYYNGIPELIKKMDWELDTLHGQINQCVARTGRTASSKPNLQNFDERLKPLFYSRYETQTS